MTATPMRCLLVDDEPLARDRLRALLEESGLDALREARSEKSLKRITVHVGCRLRVVPLEDIRWIEADEGFVFAHTPEGRYRTDFTLGELEKRLPEDHFVRTHRSAIVHIDAVYELLPEQSGTGTLRLEAPVADALLRVVSAEAGRSA